MSMHSRIRMELPTGEVKSSYCRGGDPDHMRPLLKRYYNTTEKVEELLDLGALSVLRSRVKADPGETHTFNNSLPDVTIAYARDRGEKLELGCDERGHYDYVWNGKRWYLQVDTKIRLAL